jgi:hypothetical protein
MRGGTRQFREPTPGSRLLSLAEAGPPTNGSTSTKDQHHPEKRRPDRPVPPMAGTTTIGAVVHQSATAIEEGRDLSSMSGIPADSSYRLLPA